ncbi:MAG: MBL fold metallo-hydrolase [Thermoleophilia bacterium]|nr:MBL fold metallo-hydrolase [Thermoleophilia bacterium]
MSSALTLVPVGVGAAYARPGEAQSGYLIRAAGRSFCLDLGAGALNRLQEVMHPEDLDAVVISHLHPDHVADLLSLSVYMAYGPGMARPPLRVIGPPGLEARLAAFGAPGLDLAFVFEELAAGEGQVDLGAGVRLTHREVPHLPPTHALRVDLDGRSVCYGSDCAMNDALPDLARGADVLVLECAFGAGPGVDGVPHLTGPEAGEIARRAAPRRLLLTHCYPEYDRDAAIHAARGRFDGPVAWARQGEAVSA